jgi:hypothetical protein
MTKSIRTLTWVGVAVLSALALGTIVLHRGEQINAIVAGDCGRLRIRVELPRLQQVYFG